MTVEMLLILVGALLSLGFTYIPNLNTWFAVQSNQRKQLTLLGLLALASVGLVSLSCAGLTELPFVANVTCDRPGILKMVEVFVLALMSNQGTDRISPEPIRVRMAKALGDNSRSKPVEPLVKFPA